MPRYGPLTLEMLRNLHRELSESYAAPALLVVPRRAAMNRELQRMRRYNWPVAGSDYLPEDRAYFISSRGGPGLVNVFGVRWDAQDPNAVAAAEVEAHTPVAESVELSREERFAAWRKRAARLIEEQQARHE